MTKQKTKQFLLNLVKNKTLICCLILALTYLVSGYCKWVEICLPVFALFMFAFLNVNQALCVFMFMHCFTLSNLCVESLLCVTIVVFCLVMLVKYIIGVVKKQYKVYGPLLIVILSLMCASSILSLFYPFFGIAANYLTYLPIFYCIFAMRAEFDILKIMRYFTFGLFLSCALSFLCFILPKYQYHCFLGNRYTGFVSNPNYLYMRALLVITFYMFLSLSGQLKFWKFLLVYGASAVIVLATLSKTGAGMLVLFTLVYLIISLAQDFKRRVKFAAIFVLIVLVVVAACWNFIQLVINRFLYNNGNIINSLLTGRDLIWIDYWKASTSNVFNLLFGFGIFSQQVYVKPFHRTVASHNFYLFLLNRFGLVGIIALGIIVFLMVKQVGKKPAKYAWLPLAWWLLEGMCDNTFKCFNIMLLVLACMALFYRPNKNQPPPKTHQTI